MNSVVAPSVVPARRAIVVVVYTLFFFGVLPAFLLLLGDRCDALLHLPPAGLGVRAVGAMMLMAGVAGIAWSMITLSRIGRGLPISHLPPERLVARGPYAHARHPIYVAYALAFAGVGLATGSFGRGVLATVVLVLGSVIYALGFEEERLHRRFGVAYARYAAEVSAFGVTAGVLRAVWCATAPSIERLANHVVLARRGRFIVVTYGAFAALGAAVGLSILHASSRLSPWFPIALAASIVLFARVFALLYDLPSLLRAPLTALRRVGFVSFGGYFGGALATIAFGGSSISDRLVVAGLTCSAIGRIGCLTYGCCYGRRAEHGIHFHHPDSKVVRLGDDGARVPTQLLSAAWTAVLVPVAIAITHRAAPGVAMVIAMFLYALGRFAIECLRDEPRFGFFTRGQLLAALIGGAALVALLATPFVGAATPIAFALPSGREFMAIGVASLLVLVAMGLHIDRVGRW
jgi:protein-S-isoprenylcysteine O-methyltransferase Ste14/prolipoprotein diacylglyceryltransferase